MTAAAPSGVVTFLFTDIEGSTRRWEADADAMRAALMAHDEVLRTAIESHGGFLFSHTGDGVVAAFASPKSAVDAAVAAQQNLGLPVRMGLATGEAELRDVGLAAQQAAVQWCEIQTRVGGDQRRPVWCRVASLAWCCWSFFSLPTARKQLEHICKFLLVLHSPIDDLQVAAPQAGEPRQTEDHQPIANGGDRT
jgi:hypothetical protein